MSFFSVFQFLERVRKLNTETSILIEERIHNNYEMEIKQQKFKIWPTNIIGAVIKVSPRAMFIEIRRAQLSWRQI